MPKQTFFNLPEQKHRRIVDCAVEEFARQGYHGASINRIVDAAGIAKGSFYQYFEDKDDLYLHLMDLIVQQKLATIRRHKDRLAELNLTEFLRFVFRQQLEQFRDQPLLMKVGLDFAMLTGEPVYQRMMQSYKGIADAYFLPYIQYEKAQGEIRESVNEQLLNFMLISLGQYMTSLLMGGVSARDLNEGLIDRMVDDLDDILRNGIYTLPA